MRGINGKEKRRLVNLLCLTETKLHQMDQLRIRQIGGSRWIEWAELEAQGSSGGILVYWDKRR